MLYLYYVPCVALSKCVSASVWCSVVLEHFVCGILVFYASVLMVCAVHTWLEACWCYVPGLSVGDVVSECRLNHYWPVHCGPWGFWGFMTAWNKGFVSPGLCSGMSFLWWWRAWIWYCSYGKSKLWFLKIYHTQNVQGPQNNTRLQKHTHP